MYILSMSYYFIVIWLISNDYMYIIISNFFKTIKTWKLFSNFKIITSSFYAIFLFTNCVSYKYLLIPNEFLLYF